MTAARLFGRADELAAVDALLERAPCEGGALLVRGQAGIGKSELLAAASAAARERRMGVLSATGVQSEADLAFAGLHQLLLPIAERVDRLRAPQRDALSAAIPSGAPSPRSCWIAGSAPPGWRSTPPPSRASPSCRPPSSSRPGRY